MTSPRISVIVPTYRRGASLGRAIRALTAQNSPAHEILVIDQNAPGWLARELGSTLDPVRVIWTDRANASFARNLGFVRSSGDVVLFIDDDLVPEPDLLSRAAAALAEFPDVGCLCPQIVTDEDDRTTATRTSRATSLRRHPRSSELLAMRSVISAAMFFRRSTYEASGGFDELLFDYARAGEDQELCFRMNARGLVVWLDTRLAIYHDERVPGGCELRTRPFWESRERAIRSNVLRARLHAQGRIELAPFIRLLRSSFLNSNMVRHSPAWTVRNASMLAHALVDSGRLLRERRRVVPELGEIDHLADLGARESTG